MREQTADIQQKVATELAALETPYEMLDIDPAFADTAAFCEKYGYELGVSANTIVIGSRREPRKFCACVVLANSRLDVNHAVRRLMGTRRLSFASAADTVRITGMELGGVTVFALPPDIPLYVDAKVMEPEFVILGGGDRSTKIKISPSVFDRMSQARVVDGLAISPPSE